MSGRTKAYKGGAMEGFIARWYTKNMEKNEMAEYRRAAQEVAEQAPEGGAVLEVAPGPGFLAIELAAMGKHTVTGLDVSKTFVEIATRRAEAAGVSVDFRRGNASAMPFPDGAFDFVTCRSAFKNFGDPRGALDEIYRVLKPGGRAIIDDLRRDADDSAIRERVASMGLSWFNAMLTRWIFRNQLLKRAYLASEVEAMLADIKFTRYEVRAKPLELSAWLWK